MATFVITHDSFQTIFVKATCFPNPMKQLYQCTEHGICFVICKTYYVQTPRFAHARNFININHKSQEKWVRYLLGD